MMTQEKRSHVLDGNAVVGVLTALGAHDPSELILECGSCGAADALACWVVEADDAGYIVRCRACSRTLATILREGEQVEVLIAGACRMRTRG